MREKRTSTCLLVWVIAARIRLGPGALAARAAGSAMTVQVLLIWATNDSKSPNPKHKPVEPDIRNKLKEIPLRWSNFFEENRKILEIPKGGMKRVSMSGSCETELKNLDGSRVEITHYGKGKNVGTRTQEFPKGEIIALGG